MFKTKILTGILLVLAVLFMQVGTVFAAPTAQETTQISGTIVDVESSTLDANGVTTYLVTVKDEVTGETQIVRVSEDTAASLGLLQKDPAAGELVLDPTTGDPIVDETQFGQPVTIDSTQVILDEETPEEAVHPIATILADFFEMDAGDVNDLHEDGYGFGVIAQALWMTQKLETDNPEITAAMILEAKRDKDFSEFTLSDGSTPTNWGQFKKAVLDKKNNLGVIVSGHAEKDTTEEAAVQQENGKGKNKDKNKDKDNGHGQNNKP